MSFYGSQDLIRLAAALRSRADNARTGAPAFAGWKNAPLNVLDCVLSLNRHYEGFCLPRVERFAVRHPDIQELAAFRNLIVSYPTPIKFSEVELAYRDDRRANTLLGVTERLLQVLHAFPTASGESRGPDSEMTRLGAWAGSVTPDDAWSFGVQGFALAGFQYLRMLFGVQTAKPDIHIRRFVSEVVGREVSDTQALTLLEAAAMEENLPLADLDYSIWLERSGASYEKTRVQNSSNEITGVPESRAYNGRPESEITVDTGSRRTPVTDKSMSVNSEILKVLLHAYSTVDERGELPSTYIARNPRYFYVPKPGKNPSSGLKKDYILYDFQIFRPYVKEVRRDSQGIYYTLVDELKPQLREFKSSEGEIPEATIEGNSR
jgi:hypothetical protein